MKFCFLFFTYLFLINHHTAFAQLELCDVRDEAMGNASVAISSPDKFSKNIAIIPDEKITSIRCSAISNYSIKELSPVFLSLFKSFNETLSINASIGKMGNNSFSEDLLEAGISKKLGAKFSAGIKIHYHRWILNDFYYENSHSFIPTIYLYVNPIKNLGFGVIILNPVRSRMNAIEQHKLPAKITTGISIRVSDKLQLGCSVTQQSNLPFSTQFGAEYIYHPKFILRFGWYTSPVSPSFGFALRFSKFVIDFAFKPHPDLGNSSSIALTFRL